MEIIIAWAILWGVYMIFEELIRTFLYKGYLLLVDFGILEQDLITSADQLTDFVSYSILYLGVIVVIMCILSGREEIDLSPIIKWEKE